jgi:hypothetical protein
MGNRKFHTLPIDTWIWLWKEVHTAYTNNHYLNICIQKVKLQKFWWMLLHPSCSQEVSVKVTWLILLLLLILLVPPSSTTQLESLSPLPTFSRTPLKCHLLQMLAFNMYVFLSLLSSHLSLGLHWSLLPPVLPELKNFMASLSSFVARFLVWLSWPALVIITAFCWLCPRYSLLIYWLFQWLFWIFGPQHFLKTIQ